MPRKAAGAQAQAKATAVKPSSGSIQKDKPAAASAPKSTVVKAPPVDDMCPGHERLHIWIDPEAKQPWCAMTNQTNVGANNNKYYLLQLLQDNVNASQYYTWFRWGRVGATAGNEKSGPFSLDQAKSTYCKKFQDKTKNSWPNILKDAKSFKPASGKYTLVEMDYSNSKGGGSGGGGGGNDDEEDEEDEEFAPSTLSAEVQMLVQLICDVNMIKASLLKQGCDLEKMPLGKISKSMVEEGYKALKELETELDGKKNKQSLIDLSSRFYTVVPHDFGFQKMQNFVIDTKDKLQVKLDLVDDLQQLYAAHEVLDSRAQRKKAREEAKKKAEKMKTKQLVEHPLDGQYAKLRCELEPMLLASGSTSPEITNYVEMFVKNTHAATHSHISVKNIKQIFRVNRPEEDKRFETFHKNMMKKKGFEDNRALLWHGSRLTNWAGILSQGLRIAPPEAPVSGYMFDKGIYLADAFSKSAQYCRVDKSKPTGLLLLCEVSLGTQKKFFSAEPRAASQIDYQKHHSSYGVGGSKPDPSADAKPTSGELKGIRIPQGAMINNPDIPAKDRSVLLYNEFIIYKLEQCRMRYLVEIEFNCKY